MKFLSLDSKLAPNGMQISKIALNLMHYLHYYRNWMQIRCNTGAGTKITAQIFIWVNKCLCVNSKKGVDKTSSCSTKKKMNYSMTFDATLHLTKNMRLYNVFI